MTSSNACDAADSAGAYAIRRLTPEDADVFRALRLHGLAHDPEAFGSTVEVESALPISETARRLAASLTLGAFVDDRLTGVASMMREHGPRDAHKGHLRGMYVHPDHRRSGVGAALVAAVVAASRGIVEQLLLSVVRDNAAAFALYRKAGFEVYGTEPRALKSASGYADEVLMVRFLEPIDMTGRSAG